MVRAALRWEISGLRASWERFPSAPYRHASPLEMTMLASAPLVISTEAKRSGEISPSDGTGGITVGDLSTQSIINAFSLCPIPTRSSARDDGGGERPPSFRPKRSGVEKSHSSMVKKALRQLFNPPLLSVFSPGSLPVWRRRE